MEETAGWRGLETEAEVVRSGAGYQMWKGLWTKGSSIDRCMNHVTILSQDRRLIWKDSTKACIMFSDNSLKRSMTAFEKLKEKKGWGKTWL